MAYICGPNCPCQLQCLLAIACLEHLFHLSLRHQVRDQAVIGEESHTRTFGHEIPHVIVGMLFICRPTIGGVIRNPEQYSVPYKRVVSISWLG